MNLEWSFEDFIFGFIYGQVTMFVVGVWSLLIGVVTGVLWWLGGQGFLGTKDWRREGCPFITSSVFFFGNHLMESILLERLSGALISLPLQIIAFHIGYGEPSAQPPDEGSWLGKRFGKWTRPVWFLILIISMGPLFL